jgi:hypothetical protein
MFAGIAGLALAATGIAPAMAQYSDRSTPEERAQTQDLNRDALPGQTAGPNSQDAADYDAARADYDQARQRYEQDLDNYNARSRAYQDQRRRYDQNANIYDQQRDTYSDQREDYANQRDTYEERSDAYSDDTYPSANDVYPPEASPPAAYTDTADLWTLDHFTDPNYELYNMPVVDVDGFTVGHFRRIETRDNGDRMAVVTLNSMRTVSLPMQDMYYDPNMAVVVAELTSDQIDRTPSGVFGP